MLDAPIACENCARIAGVGSPRLRCLWGLKRPCSVWMLHDCTDYLPLREYASADRREPNDGAQVHAN